MRSSKKRASGERSVADGDTEITITQHAIARYAERARVGGSPRRLAEELRDHVRDALEERAFFPDG